MLLLLLESDINGTRLKCFEPFRGREGSIEFFVMRNIAMVTMRKLKSVMKGAKSDALISRSLIIVLHYCWKSFHLWIAFFIVYTLTISHNECGRESFVHVNVLLENQKCYTTISDAVTLQKIAFERSRILNSSKRFT